MGFTDNKKINGTSTGETELKAFFECGGDDEDPLAWFGNHQHLMPTLAGFAIKYFQIPATSASSERLFSKAGRIYSPLRCSLSYQTGQVLVFLRANEKIASKYSLFSKTYGLSANSSDESAIDTALENDLDENLDTQQ